MSFSDDTSSELSDVSPETLVEEVLALKRKIKRLGKMAGPLPIDEFIDEKLIGRVFQSKKNEDKEDFIDRVTQKVKLILKPYYITNLCVYCSGGDYYFFDINHGEMFLLFKLNRHDIGMSTFYSITITKLEKYKN